MSVLTILGNGLDLAHGLKTKFDDFMKTLPIEQQEKYSVFRNKDNSWNCVESKYEELLRTIMDSREWKTVIDEVDCIRDGYGYNEYGEIDYYGYDFDGCDKELDEISDLISLLKDFENDFWEYLKLRCNDEILNDVSPIKSIFEIVRQSSRIVTFNYTHTLEILYGAKNTIHITCKLFFAKVITMMDWNPDYRYKLLGKLIHANEEYLLAFDLTATEVYQRTFPDGQKPKTSRAPVFPAEWQDQFGLSYSEHRQSMQINIFDGYAIFAVKENGADGENSLPSAMPVPTVETVSEGGDA